VAQAKYLLIGSTASYSGKSATILGIAHQLQERGTLVAYGKPLGTYLSQNSTGAIEEDVRFIARALNLPVERVRSPLICLDEETITQKLQNPDLFHPSRSLQTHFQNLEGELILLEGPGTLCEGSLFNLSVEQMTQIFDASVLLVARFNSLLLADELLAAKQQLGDRLLGVAINDIPEGDFESVTTVLQPFLERQGIPVFGTLPRSNLLNSVSVRELTKQLNAKVLCRPDRLDLMVESLVIGAMNVNSALEYFRKGRNMAVVTGGDRTELQLAALETSTNCLILTGHSTPQGYILQRAEDMEVPILSVDLDTLTTVEIADRAFGQVRLQEVIKVQCIQDMMAEHFDIERLMAQLGVEPALSA